MVILEIYHLTDRLSQKTTKYAVMYLYKSIRRFKDMHIYNYLSLTLLMHIHIFKFK